MNIIHVSDTSIYNFDGISTYLNELIKCSELSGDKVLVLTTSPISGKNRTCSYKNTIVKVFPSFRFPGKPKFVTVLNFGMRKIIRDFEPDLIWIHSIGTPGQFAALIGKGKYRIVYTKHCFDGELWNNYLNIPLMFRWFLDKVAEKMENKILESVDNVVYHLNNKTKVQNNRYFHKFITIPPPLPSKFFENRPTAKTKKNKLTIGFCGRCEPDKGLETTFAALKLFTQQHKNINAEFLIIGDGPEAHRLKKKYSNLNVLITGYVDDVIPYLDQLDAFVLSSKHETISLSSLEAYARGIPIFSVPIGYLEEVCKNLSNYHLFDTPEKLAALLYDVMILKIDMKNKEVCSINSMVVSYTSLYNQIVK